VESGDEVDEVIEEDGEVGREEVGREEDGAEDEDDGEGDADDNEVLF
jgi:hypothetical protein